MPGYIFGVLVGFLEPVLHAWSNILDNYFANKVFPKLPVLLFFGTALNFLFVPIIFIAGVPSVIPLQFVPLVAFIGLINVLYLFPYYWSLRHTDTSVVASLFALGKIAVPILAFFILGEILLPIQYAGFALIIIASGLLTLNIRELRVNKAFVLMLIVSLLLALQAIAYKYVFDAGVSWSSVALYLVFVEFLIAGVVMLVTTRMQQIMEDFRTIRNNVKLFGLQQGLEWGGYAGASYAISVLPVTLAQAIVGTQPIFVLCFALIFKKRFGAFFNELTGKKDLAKKIFLFLAIILGTILIVANGTNIES